MLVLCICFPTNPLLNKMCLNCKFKSWCNLLWQDLMLTKPNRITLASSINHTITSFQKIKLWNFLRLFENVYKKAFVFFLRLLNSYSRSKAVKSLPKKFINAKARVWADVYTYFLILFMYKCIWLIYMLKINFEYIVY